MQPQDIHPATAGLRSFEFGFALFEAFDTPASAASQNTNQFSKSSQSIVEFSTVQSIWSSVCRKFRNLVFSARSAFLSAKQAFLSETCNGF